MYTQYGGRGYILDSDSKYRLKCFLELFIFSKVTSFYSISMHRSMPQQDFLNKLNQGGRQ